MAYSNKEALFWDAISLAANKDGEGIECRNQRIGLAVLRWTGASATDAVIKWQRSLDKAKWFDISGKSTTIAAASGDIEVEFSDANLCSGWIRPVLAKNSETTGTVNIQYLLKGQ
jgi:hypothetical protein